MPVNPTAAPYFWVYRRGDGYLGLINAGSERTARAMLNPLPQGYTLLDYCTSLESGRERIENERHGNL